MYGFELKLSKDFDTYERHSICKILKPFYRPDEKVFCYKDIDQIELSIPEDQMIRRLNNFEPLDYILGYSHFFDLKLAVNKDVLIPRSETEELVWYLKNEILASRNLNRTVLDIGTGSGCIAIGLKHMIPSLNITAIDKSAEALQIARANAHRLGLDILFKHIDFLDPTRREQLDTPYDIIVSNPPYIDVSEQHMMDHQVVRHEPQMALFTESDPQIFYRTIMEFDSNKSGLIYVEINALRAKTVMKIFQSKYRYTHLIHDLQNQPRIIRANNQTNFISDYFTNPLEKI